MSNIEHPSYYQGKVEVIDVIDSFTSRLRGIEAFDSGNCIKYLCRWSEKGGLEDLKKARWYLDHLINHVEEESA